MGIDNNGKSMFHTKCNRIKITEILQKFDSNN